VARAGTCKSLIPLVVLTLAITYHTCIIALNRSSKDSTMKTKKQLIASAINSANVFTIMVNNSLDKNEWQNARKAMVWRNEEAREINAYFKEEVYPYFMDYKTDTPYNWDNIEIGE
jgi:hypothetical protein